MAELEFEVRSDSTRAIRDLNRLDRAVGSIEGNVNRVSRSFEGFQRAAAVGFAAISAGAGLTALARTTDVLRNINTQLGLVTTGIGEFGQAQQAVNRITLQTRSSLSGTGVLYARLARSARALGASTRDTETATQAVAQAIGLSGANSESANAAIVQLGQGLASGQLRGQELNSVLEQTPRVARAIIDGLRELDPSLNASIGNIRQLAEEGRLTSDVVFRALVNQAEQLNREFSGASRTFAQATNVLSTGTTVFLGNLDMSLGITSRLIEAFISIGEVLADTGARIPFLFDRIDANIDNLAARSILAFGRIRGSLSGAFEVPRTIFSSLGARVAEAAEGLEGPRGSALGLINGFLDSVRTAFTNAFNFIVGGSVWPDTIDGVNEYSENLSTTPISSWITRVQELFDSINIGDIFSGIGDSLPSLDSLNPRNIPAVDTAVTRTLNALTTLTAPNLTDLPTTLLDALTSAGANITLLGNRVANIDFSAVSEDTVDNLNEAVVNIGTFGVALAESAADDSLSRLTGSFLRAHQTLRDSGFFAGLGSLLTLLSVFLPGGVLYKFFAYLSLLFAAGRINNAITEEANNAGVTRGVSFDAQGLAELFSRLQDPANTEEDRADARAELARRRTEELQRLGVAFDTNVDNITETIQNADYSVVGATIGRGLVDFLSGVGGIVLSIDFSSITIGLSKAISTAFRTAGNTIGEEGSGLDTAIETLFGGALVAAVVSSRFRAAIGSAFAAALTLGRSTDRAAATRAADITANATSRAGISDAVRASAAAEREAAAAARNAARAFGTAAEETTAAVSRAATATAAEASAALARARELPPRGAFQTLFAGLRSTSDSVTNGFRRLVTITTEAGDALTGFTATAGPNAARTARTFFPGRDVGAAADVLDEAAAAARAVDVSTDREGIRLIRTAANNIDTTLGGLFGSISRLLGETTRILGRLFIPINVILATFDGITAAFNDDTVRDVVGLEPDEAITASDRLQAAGAGVIEGFLTGFIDLFGLIAGGLGLEEAVASLTGFTQSIRDFVRPTIRLIVNTLSVFVDNITGFLAGILRGFRSPDADSLSNTEVIDQALASIIGATGGVLSFVGGIFGSAADALESGEDDVTFGETIGNIIGTAIGGIVDFIGALINFFTFDEDNALRGIVERAWNNVTDSINAAIAGIVSFFNTIAGFFGFDSEQQEADIEQARAATAAGTVRQARGDRQGSFVSDQGNIGALLAQLEAGEITTSDLVTQISDLASALDSEDPTEQRQIIILTEILAALNTQGFQTGGFVSGPGSGTSDSILARVSNGEYVVRAASVNRYGVGLLDAINNGTFEGFARGGLVGFQAGGIVERINAALASDDLADNNVRILETILSTIRTRENTASLFEANLLRIQTTSAEDNKISTNELENIRDANTRLEAAQMALNETQMSALSILDSIDSKTTPGSDAAAAAEGMPGIGQMVLDLFDIGEDAQVAISNGVRSSFATGLNAAFTGEGSVGDLVSGVLDTFTRDIIGNFTSNITSSLFNGAGSNLFGSGGGGDLLTSLFGSFSGFFGFNQGGVVPNTPYSVPGRDSVPTLLTPGERIIPANESEASSVTVNLNVTGNIDDATDRRIMEMLPRITDSVQNTFTERRLIT